MACKAKMLISLFPRDAWQAVECALLEEGTGKRVYTGKLTVRSSKSSKGDRGLGCHDRVPVRPFAH